MLNLSHKPQAFKMVTNQELKTALTIPNFSCTAADETMHQHKKPSLLNAPFHTRGAAHIFFLETAG